MIMEGLYKSNSVWYRWNCWSKSNSEFNSLQKFKIICIPEIQDFFKSEKRNKLWRKYVGFSI